MWRASIDGNWCSHQPWECSTNFLFRWSQDARILTNCVPHHKVTWSWNAHWGFHVRRTSSAQDTLYVRPSSSLISKTILLFRLNLLILERTVWGWGFVQDSVLDIVTRYGLYSPGIEPLWRWHFRHLSNTGRGAQRSFCKMRNFSLSRD